VEVVGWGCNDGPAFDGDRPAEDCVFGFGGTDENGLGCAWLWDV